jgi:energy-coupling factor transporter ATP-binding protein EcfA2
MSMLRLEGVSFRYSEYWILEDLHLDLPAGRWVAIMGEMGSGKTTLAHLVKGILRPQKGRVRLFGAEIEGPMPPEIVALVETDPGVHMLGSTVGEDLALSPEFLGESQACIGKLVREALDLFGLEDLHNHPTHLLSGGERQRVALAAAWVARPALWVLDEAVSMVEPKRQVALLEIAKEGISKNGTPGGLLITNDRKLTQLAEACWTLKEGRLSLDWNS